MVVIDAIVRLLPGAIGHEQGVHDETFTEGLLEFPQYTRPREFRGRAVPDVLLSGNHKVIAQWRLEQRKQRTQNRRPDLWQAYLRAQQDKIDQESGHEKQDPSSR
jgi:tRNA (guanine37-N1)-methyltransferase